VPPRGARSLLAAHPKGGMSLHRHYSNADLMAYIEGNEAVVDIDAIRRSVEICGTCARRLRDLQSFGRLISESSVWSTVASPANLDEQVRRIRSEHERREQESTRAGAVIAQLAATEVGRWAAYIADNEDVWSEMLVQRLIDEAVARLDRRAQESLQILDSAETVTSAIHDLAASAEYLAEIWKNRANAHRMLGAYDDALEATTTAQSYAEQSPGGGFLIAQITYTRGFVLFKMGRFREAREAGREAASRFAEFGDVQRVVHARMLEAAVVTEQGDVTEALRVHQLLRPHLERLGDVSALARVTANIAVSYLRLHDFANARPYITEAREKYLELRMESEVIRADWTLGEIEVGEGASEAGLDRMRDAARRFEAIGMLADAGFVNLDIVEELLHRDEWDEAASLSRTCGDVFARSGATLHQMKALAFLREAVGRREATPKLVQYVRSYVIANDGQRPFEPPDARSRPN
jgi:tetratricopeptide (TPR) repeat protein